MNEQFWCQTGNVLESYTLICLELDITTLNLIYSYTFMKHYILSNWINIRYRMWSSLFKHILFSELMCYIICEFVTNMYYHNRPMRNQMKLKETLTGPE